LAERELERRAKHKFAVLKHVEEVSGQRLGNLPLLRILRLPRTVEASTMRIEMPENRKKYDREFREELSGSLKRPTRRWRRSLATSVGTRAPWATG
jgi:hypothetical protein